MRTINLKIDTNNRNVISMDTEFLGMENDSYQTKLVLELSEALTTGASMRCEFEIGTSLNYAVMTENDDGNYELELTNSMLSSDLSAIQFTATWVVGSTSYYWKSKQLDMHIEPSINATSETPSAFDDWLTRLQAAITQCNNLNISFDDVNNVMTITKKDGTTQTIYFPGNVKVFSPSTNTVTDVMSWKNNECDVIYYNLLTTSNNYICYRLTRIVNKPTGTPFIVFSAFHNELETTEPSEIYCHTYTFEFNNLTTTTSNYYDSTFRIDKDDYYTSSQIDTKFNDYYDSDTTDALLDTKVDKVSGKGLSTNDYTNAEKTKVGFIEEDIYTFGLRNTNDTACITTDGGYLHIKYNNNVHSVELYDLDNIATTIDLASKQNVSNLVTSISSSSTDTQYPSAKCVYDIVGDIESLLTNI